MEFFELWFGRVRELYRNSVNYDREPTLESLWCIGVPACQDIPTTLPQSGWFANHSKSFIHCSYVFCAFIYSIVELVFILSYIWSRVWESIEYSGTWCGDYYLITQRLTALIGWKILDNAVDEVSEAGVTILLGLCNPPHSWIGTVGSSLPGFTIAPCVDSLLCYRIVPAA
jgi:hypothetical protein